jgi:predicted TPR repeat methyltransferase
MRDRDTKLARATELRDAGRIHEAIHVYRGVANQDPKCGRAWFELGALLAEARHYEEAEEAFAAALKVGPPQAVLWFNRGCMLERLERVPEAIHAYESALELDAQHEKSRYNLASLLARLGRESEAEVQWRQIPGDSPLGGLAARELAALCARRGLWADAARSYAVAASLLPSDARLVIPWSICLMESGHTEEAIRVLKEACGRLGDDSRIRIRLVDSYLKADRVGQAAELLRIGRLPANEAAPLYERAIHELVHLGRQADAARLARAWLEDGSDHPAARHLLAALSGDDVPSRASDEYVRDQFDRFAATFDGLLEDLRYRAPQLIADVVRRHCFVGDRPLEALDAGCGTGICGPLIRPPRGRLHGVDLSERMLDKAREKGAYDKLHAGELTRFLAERPGRFDVIAAADTLVYFGDLLPVFTAARQALGPGGWLVFSLEKLAGPSRDVGFQLGYHGRYAHTTDYVRSRLLDAGLTIVELSEGILREQAGEPVKGLIVASQA